MQSSEPNGRARDDGLVAAVSGSGRGSAPAHHGELLQGVFRDASGRLHRGLITIPLSARRSTAIFVPESAADLTVVPADRTKARRAAEATLRRIGAGGGGKVTIGSDIPIGHGYGSSSADVVATAKAVADAFGCRLLPTILSEIAVEAEAASDAIAFGDPAVAFAHREGRVMEYLPGPLPPLLLVSMKSADARPVPTEGLKRARYSEEEAQLFCTLLAGARRAIQRQDVALLGQAATASARVSQRHLPKSGFNAALKLASTFGLDGVQVSHSGSLIGLFADARHPERKMALDDAMRAATSEGFVDVELFAIDCHGRVS